VHDLTRLVALRNNRTITDAEFATMTARTTGNTTTTS